MAQRHPSGWIRHLTEAADVAGLNAVVFLLVVASGCGYIVTAKLLKVGPFLVTFVPVGMMLAYAMLIYLARGLQLRDDQSGDNLYYMGFLFTLTSLGVSLYQFSATHAAEEIVQNFGIAIGSTIAGIGLRVIFNQMRRDPVEIERMMRLELAEAARRVRRELDSAVVEFGSFRRSAQQAATDSFAHVTEKFDQIAGTFLGRLEDVTAKLTTPLEAASRRSAQVILDAGQTLGSKLAESANVLSTASETLSTRAAAIATSLDVATTKLDALRMPDHLLEAHFTAIARSLAQATDRLTGHSEEQAAELKAALSVAHAATDRSIELITMWRQEFDTLSAMNRATLDAATSMIRSMGETLDEFTVRTKSDVEAVRFMVEKADETLRTFTDVLIKSGVEAAMQTEGLREVLPAIEAGIQSLAAAAERISGVVEGLRGARRTPKRETID